MDEEAALLRAICDHPDDDTPRLVFADWLEERGDEVDVAWAELIRVQVSLARGLSVDREHQQLLARRDRQLSSLVETSGPRRIGLPSAQWRSWARGLPLSLRCYYAGREMMRFASAPPIPLRNVEVVEIRSEELGAFLKWPGLRHVRDLALYGFNHPVAGGILALAGCEHLSNLERLRMGEVTLANEEMVAILDSPHLTRITDLRMGVIDSPRLSVEVEQRLRERFGDEWDRL